MSRMNRQSPNSLSRTGRSVLMSLALAGALLGQGGCDRASSVGAPPATESAGGVTTTPAATSTAAASTPPASTPAASTPAASTPAASTPAASTPAAATAAPGQAATPAPAPAAEETSSEGIDGPPPIRLEPEFIDFGILPPSVTKEGIVKLVNTGTKELEILTVQPSCKCTTLEDVSGKKIPAGGSIELKANMKAQSAPGKKTAEIKVLIDGYSQVIPIQLKQEVSLPIRVSPSYLNVVKKN